MRQAAALKNAPPPPDLDALAGDLGAVVFAGVLLRDAAVSDTVFLEAAGFSFLEAGGRSRQQTQTRRRAHRPLADTLPEDEEGNPAHHAATSSGRAQRRAGFPWGQRPSNYNDSGDRTRIGYRRGASAGRGAS